MAQTTIITPVQEQSDESQEKILLPPTDPNAEVLDVSGYKLVYVKGACPKVYRVYGDDSMLGLVFQHITHWANEVDKIRYAKPKDAVVVLEGFVKVADKPRQKAVELEAA
jgi:hypothetical protein